MRWGIWGLRWQISSRYFSTEEWGRRNRIWDMRQKLGYETVHACDMPLHVFHAWKKLRMWYMRSTWSNKAQNFLCLWDIDIGFWILLQRSFVPKIKKIKAITKNLQIINWSLYLMKLKYFAIFLIQKAYIRYMG